MTKGDKGEQRKKRGVKMEEERKDCNKSCYEKNTSETAAKRFERKKKNQKKKKRKEQNKKNPLVT